MSEESNSQEARSAAKKWVRSAELFDRRLQTAEGAAQLTFHHLEPKWIRYIAEERQELDLQRTKDRSHLVEDLQRVKRLVSNSKRMLDEGVEQTEVVDVLHSALSNAQKDISTLQDAQESQLSDLRKAELVLDRDLELMVEHLQASDWSTRSSMRSRPDINSHPNLTSCDGCGLLPEVLEYDDYLEIHGPTGGWETEDHKEFVRLLGICKGDYSLMVDLCCQELISIPCQEIIAHGRWHSVFCDLIDKKRAAIACWKEERVKRQSQERMDRVLQEEFHLKEATRREEEEGKVMRRIKCEIQHQLIDVWRKQKAEEKQQASEKQRLEAMQKAKKEKEVRREQEAKRTLVAQYKQQKAAAARCTLQQSSIIKEQKQLGLDAKERILRKNEEMLERRTQKTRVELQQKVEREIRIARLKEQVTVKATRDPQRLTEPTEATKQRKNARLKPQPGAAQQTSTFIRHVQHKATPTWLKNVPSPLVK